MTIRQIVKAMPSLQKIVGYELSVSQLYYAKKLINAVNNELDFYYSWRRDMIDRHCEKDGDKLKYKDGTGNAFNGELQELLDLEVDLNVKPLVLSERDDIRLTLCDMDALEGLVEIKIEGDEGRCYTQKYSGKG